MKKLTLTAEEVVLALNAVRAKHAQTLSAYGFDDLELAALLAKMESHVAPVAPVVVEEPAEVAVAEAEAEAMEAAETPAEE